MKLSNGLLLETGFLKRLNCEEKGVDVVRSDLLAQIKHDLNEVIEETVLKHLKGPAVDWLQATLWHSIGRRRCALQSINACLGPLGKARVKIWQLFSRSEAHERSTSLNSFRKISDAIVTPKSQQLGQKPGRDETKPRTRDAAPSLM